MPFRSESQRRKFWAMANRGEIKRSVAEEWERATPKGKKLPERVKHAYVDGLLKAAVKLTPEEKRRQAMQFSALGLGTIPALAMAQHRIREGRWLPKSGKGRFLAAAGLGGAFWGGLLPTLQHGIAQTNLAKARARVRAEQEMKTLVPGGEAGVQRIVKQLPLEKPVESVVMPPSPVVKTGASKIVARLNGNLKVRKGRRPMRVETLLKKASQSGADLRIPLMGGTKFPTNDSLAEARKKLKEHQDVAKPKMVRPVMQPVYGVSMPKTGSAFANDPLVQYLKKTAQKVEDNEDDMKTGPVVEERVDHGDLGFQRDTQTHSEWRQQLNELFSNKSGITKKYLDKERDA